MPTLQKISPFLWFNNQAEEAATYYVSIFNNSKITAIARYGEAGREHHRQTPGTVMTIAFELDGQKFSALNGGPIFQFSPAISFVIHCDSQDEIDHFWDKLSAGGDPAAQQCGWLKDKFGLSWQIIPSILPKLMTDPDPARSGRAMKALMQMKKLDIAQLQSAHAGN